MTVLGIDPGLERLGYAVVRKEGSQLSAVTYGLVQTPRIALPERLRILHTESRALMEQFRPDALANERLFFTKNQTTGMDVAKALGCVLLAAAESGLECTEYTPPQIKLAVTGTGSADKKQVQFMVTRLLGLAEPPKPDDVADAIAVAITHLMVATPARTL